MNEITRKAANALVAAVDFFQGALAAEAQAGDAKQVQLDALAGQLKQQDNFRKDLENVLADADKEVARLRELLEAGQKANLEVTSAWANARRERDDLLLKCKNLSSENGALREVATRARTLLPLKPGTKTYEKAREFLARDVKALDG